ncbi:hypothetical protein CHS0354_041985 [Potamilus streckersoni]|uniref:Uncharacterized protein n=1 Tax=Potamilus streckersoni TaxID=2493646 RepID=A0AAE0TAP0_9BIVA|nr:hypothetical protein CHS0354_041985 [Potamilus streckersoni]
MLNSTILPSRTILTIFNKNYLQLINPSSLPMYVPANTVLASVDAIHPQTIFTINEDTLDRNDTPDIMNTQSSKVQVPINFDLNSSDLTETQKQTLCLFLNQNRDVFLNQNRDVFAVNLQELVSSNVFTHRRETGDSMPVHCQPYRAAPYINKEIDR